MKRELAEQSLAPFQNVINHMEDFKTEIISMLQDSVEVGESGDVNDQYCDIDDDFFLVYKRNLTC